jgi:hypothetical protein
MYMSLGKQQDTTLANRRLSSRIRFKIHDRRETTRHDTSKATPTEDAIGSEHEPGNPQNTTPSVATRIDTTPNQDSIFANMSPGKPQDTTQENRRRADTTPTQHVNETNTILGTPCDTILANRRRASRRNREDWEYSKDKHRDPYNTVANRRRAQRRKLSRRRARRYG